MTADWQTDRVYFSALLPARYPGLWARLARVLDAAGVPHRLLPGTRDIWARDFMPVQVAAGRFVRFRYRPDYLAGHVDLITPDAVRRALPLRGRVRNCSINLDGGNIVAGESRAIMTNKVYRANPGFRPAELRHDLERLLRAECIVIPTEPYDVVGHADGVVRFINDAAVVVNDYRQTDPGYGTRLEKALRRRGLDIERLPHFPTDDASDRIPSAVGNYINFLGVGSLVVVPVYGAPQDDRACRMLERLLPSATIVPLRCEELAREGGVLNCVAWCVRSTRCVLGLRDRLATAQTAHDPPGS